MKKFFTQFLPRVFTPSNLSKVLLIFFVGLFGRYCIDYFGGINVFVEYLNPVSIAFYSFMAAFAVFISELFSFFNCNLIPTFVSSFFSHVFSMLITTLSFVTRFKFEYLSISFIRKVSRDFFHSFHQKLFLSDTPSIIRNLFTQKDLFCILPKPPSSSTNLREENLLRESVRNIDKDVNRFKRKLFWLLIEKSKHKFRSYDDFKWHWNSETNLTKELKYELTVKYNSVRRTIKVQKDTLKWFLGDRNL